MKHWLPRLFALLAALAAPALGAQQGDPELLPPEEAFRLETRTTDVLNLQWHVADGYYLYKSKFRFTTTTPGVTLGEPRMPEGKIKEDEFFGRMEIFRGTVPVEVPVSYAGAAPARIDLEATSQGCADFGICYPPYTHTVSMDAPALLTAADAPPGRGTDDPLGALARLGEALDANTAGDEFLDPDVAFVPSVRAPDAGTLLVRWEIAEHYYLYRDKFKFKLLGAPGASLGEPRLAPGKRKHDEFFGEVEVYYHDAVATLPVQGSLDGATDLRVEVGYQGCADAGLCYPPITKQLPVNLTAGGAAGGPSPAMPAAVVAAVQGAAAADEFVAEQDQIARSLAADSLWLTVLSFFGFGLLLAFTPCVFPMIPILSSIIVGQGSNLHTRKAFVLSLVYVLAMALTYTVAGVLAGLFGGNLQAMFQDPWILSAFAGVFVLLSLSMFGFYELQIPASWQSKLTALSNRQEGGTLMGVGIMGFLSALIVGPCVAAPLAGALIYIGQTGDAVLGGVALFALSMGMGAPLIAIGTSAGKLLPRAGPWMNAIKGVFGVMLLAVAIYLLERIIPAWATMLLWAVLLIVAAIYMGALDHLQAGVSGWRRLWKGAGLVMMVYGILLMVGAAGGGTDVLQPLRGVALAGGGAGPASHGIEFRQVKGMEQLQAEIRQATAQGRPVMLDYYADWCISCKEMEKYTFSDPGVQAALADTVLLQTDVTANDELDQQMLREFGLFGPPAILFFGADGQERSRYRVVGFMDAERFRAHVLLAKG